jgi:hypothetical protein
MRIWEKVKPFVLFLCIFAVSVFVILVGIRIYMELNSPKFKTPELSYNLAPTKTSLKVGEKVSVPLYLAGKDAGKTSAYDVKFYYDATKFKVTKVTPGGFFEKYITVKWDQNQAWFALAMTPSKPKIEANSGSAILTLELTAIAKTAATPVSTGTSLVYLTKTGGFHPEAATVNFSIK